MNKFLNALAAIMVITFTCVANAGIVSSTFLGSLAPKATKTLKIQVPTGSHRIEVYDPREEATFTCAFLDTATGFTGLEQVGVARCSGHLNADMPLVIAVTFTNLSSKTTEYRVTMEPTK